MGVVDDQRQRIAGGVLGDEMAEALRDQLPGRGVSVAGRGGTLEQWPSERRAAREVELAGRPAEGQRGEQLARDAEGRLLIEHAARGAKPAHSGGAGHPARLGQQARLADSCVAVYQYDPGLSGGGRADGFEQPGAISVALEQRDRSTPWRNRHVVVPPLPERPPLGCGQPRRGRGTPQAGETAQWPSPQGRSVRGSIGRW